MAIPSPLLRNLLLFGHLLRALGLRVTSAQLVEVMNSFTVIDIGRKEDFHNAARCILVSRQADLPIFDYAFDAFWRFWSHGDKNQPLEKLISDIARQAPRSPGTPPPGMRGKPGQEPSNRIEVGPSSRGSEGAEDNDGAEGVIALYSPGEVLRSKDFGAFSQEEISDARRFLAEMQWTVTRRRSRRSRPAVRGRTLDVRRSLRRSVASGGEMLNLAHRGPKLKRRSLVLICDISGSMDRYTRLLLHFLYAVESSIQQVEVFAFGTRLTRITPSLRSRDPDAAVATVAQEVKDWSGGTRIGESLRTFNRQWARRVMGHGAIVVIISDGWDRGEPALLEAEMQRLQRSSYRLLWLNPLLGSANYQPLTQGIQAALPYVDDFVPIHNLNSLEALGRLLNQVQEGRPARRQRARSSQIQV